MRLRTYRTVRYHSTTVLYWWPPYDMISYVPYRTVVRYGPVEDTVRVHSRAESIHCFCRCGGGSKRTTGTGRRRAADDAAKTDKNGTLWRSPWPPSVLVVFDLPEVYLVYYRMSEHHHQSTGSSLSKAKKRNACD